MVERSGDLRDSKSIAIDMALAGASSKEIAKVTGFAIAQAAGIKSNAARGAYAARSTGASDLFVDSIVAETEGALETAFRFERDLQRALRANISQIDPGLKIIDGGKEQILPSGRIDILAEDADGNKVVIELKAGEADRDAIGQILSYMGDLAAASPAAAVKGIIVAGDFSSRAISAARMASSIRLLKYSYQFTFSTIS